MIYFNNAATTWPKPDIVYYTADTVAKKHGGNAGRGGNAMAVAAAKEIYNCRCALASFLVHNRKTLFLRLIRLMP